MAVEISTLGAVDEGLLPTLQQQATRALEALGLGEAELSVVLCDDASIQPLNQEWRGRDEATDVLSFPQDGPDWTGIEGGPPRVLGDVVISAQTAARQAQSLQHSLQRELAVLLVHGLCHLLGHDHQDPEQTAAMRAEEEKLLRALGESGVGLVERADPSPQAGVSSGSAIR